MPTTRTSISRACLPTRSKHREQPICNWRRRVKNSYFTGDLSQLAVGQIVRANGGALRIASVEAGLAKAEAIMPPATLNTVAAGTWDILSFSEAEADRRIDDREVVWLESLRDKGAIEKHFAWRFFTSGDSREPELAGLRGAIVGSLLTLIMTLSLSVPLGIAAAVYLEEFARQEQVDGTHRGQHQQPGRGSLHHLRPARPCRVHQFLRPAAFGTAGGRAGAGAACLAHHHHRDARGAEGGAALDQGGGTGGRRLAPAGGVPPCAAAGGVPASSPAPFWAWRAPLARRRRLLMIGMVAFIVDVPKGFTEAATVLPVQIYLWSDLPEVAFQSRTAAAIIVLLVILFCLNAVAIYLRKRFERRW